MDLLMQLTVIAFPIFIIVLVSIGVLKVFLKKKSITPYYTPFDEITGHSPVTFHEEQETIVQDEGQDQDKNNKKSKKD